MTCVIASTTKIVATVPITGNSTNECEYSEKVTCMAWMFMRAWVQMVPSMRMHQYSRASYPGSSGERKGEPGISCMCMR